MPIRYNKMDHVDKIRELADFLRAESALAEKAGRLTDQQLEILYKHKLFKLFVPETFGGLGLTLPEALLIEEEMAAVDGSLGWTLTLCAGANLFVGYLASEMSRNLFIDERVCLGGSGKASGVATITEDGYLITGRWDYATGAPHNTAFTANCILQHREEPALGEDGNPLIKSFIFLRNEVSIVENSWNTMGLRATASATFTVENLFVDKTRSFEIQPHQAVLADLIYQYPFQQLAETTLAVNTLGMGRHFLACCREILQQRYPEPDNHIPWKSYHKAVAEIQKLRSFFFSEVETSWQQMHQYSRLQAKTKKNLSAISKQLVRSIQEHTTLLYPYCGMDGARLDQELNRVWRDLFTASQHNLLLNH